MLSNPRSYHGVFCHSGYREMMIKVQNPAHFRVLSKIMKGSLGHIHYPHTSLAPFTMYSIWHQIRIGVRPITTIDLFKGTLIGVLHRGSQFALASLWSSPRGEKTHPRMPNGHDVGATASYEEYLIRRFFSFETVYFHTRHKQWLIWIAICFMFTCVMP